MTENDITNNEDVPFGYLLFNWMGDYVPEGWIKCDGKSTYIDELGTERKTFKLADTIMKLPNKIYR